MEEPGLPNAPSLHPTQPQTKKLSRSSFWLGASLVLMVLSLIRFFYITHHISVNPVKPIPIVSAPAVKKDVPVYLTALGNVIPTYSVQVRAQVSGVLQSVAFIEGQLVKKGQLIAQIDPRPYEALLVQYEGDLKRDSALLANAQIDLKRYQKLWSQDSISQQTLATQIALVEQYEGTVNSDKGLIQSTKVNLIYCHIESPIDGRIGLRLVDPGNLVQPTDTSGIAVINTLNPITVVFTLPEDNIPQLLPQVYAHQKVQVEAYDRQQNQWLASGELLTMDNQISTSTGTVKLKAVFDNQDNKLFPNQFVNIKVLVQTLPRAILVPTAAIQHSLTKEFVYILENNKVAIKTVTTGISIDNDTVIHHGLSKGQWVVVEGADKLINGAHILDETKDPNTSLKTEPDAHPSSVTS